MRCLPSRSEYLHAAAALLPATLMTVAWLGSTAAAADEQPRTANLFTLRRTALFQTTCQRDYAEALAEWSWAGPRKSFEQFDRQLWISTSPRKGWSYFMSTAVMAVGSAERNRPLILFYHPWTDVFLVTMWTEETAQPWLEDVEVITGEWVRRGTVPSLAAAGQLPGEALTPQAVAQTTAESLRAFKRRFGGIDPRHWRAALPDLDDPEVRETFDYPRAAQRLKSGLARVDEFQQPHDGEDPRLASIRASSDAAIKLAIAGHFDELLSQADETLRETADQLRKITPEQFQALVVASAQVGRGASFVYLQAPAANWFVGLNFAGPEDTQKLRRIDLVTFEGVSQPEARSESSK